MSTSTHANGKPFAHLAKKDTPDAQGPAPTARRLRRRHEYDPMRVSALAYQHLGDECLALDAAYHPDNACPREHHPAWASQHRISRAADSRPDTEAAAS